MVPKVGLIDLVMMRFRKVNAKSVVINRISGKKAGIEISTDQLEAHYLAGGRITNVVRAMIAADKARIDLQWETATAIDLAGRDIWKPFEQALIQKLLIAQAMAEAREPSTLLQVTAFNLKHVHE